MWKYTKTTKQIESLYITKGSFLKYPLSPFSSPKYVIKIERGDTRCREPLYESAHISKRKRITKETAKWTYSFRTDQKTCERASRFCDYLSLHFCNKKQPPKRRDTDKIGVTNMDLFNCTKIGEIAVRLPVQFRPQIGHKQTNKNYETGTELQMLF